MSEIIAIEGGHKLNGTVEISGAKNATVALIPAIILADSPQNDLWCTRNQRCGRFSSFIRRT